MPLATLRRVFSLTCLLMLSIVTVAGAQPVPVLAPGATYEFLPSDTFCETETQGEEGALPVVEAECDEATGTAGVKVITNLSLRKLDMEARARFEMWVQIEGVPEAVEQSWIPVAFRLPDIRTRLRALNGSFDVGNLAKAGANVLFTLRADPSGTSRGTVIERRRVVSVTHGGIGGGCAVSTAAALASGSVAGTAAAVYSCLAGIFMKIEDDGNISLSTVLEAGRTYSIEVEVEAFAFKPFSPDTFALSVRPFANGDPVLKWNKLIVTVGSDPQAFIADLQEQIDELREAFEGHAHEYLTGRGRGHNNMAASTSPPLPE